jgi:Holliday junction resolvase RusA-like endonuclease
MIVPGEVIFSVPGEPFSKQRARTTKNGTYTPKPTVLAERRVREAYVDAGHAGRATDTESAFSLRIVSYRHERYGRDADNLAKTVMDALNHLIWADDSQVENLIQTTIWVDDKAEARTYVEAHNMGTRARPPRRK